jgi:hypothetical protein
MKSFRTARTINAARGNVSGSGTPLWRIGGSIFIVRMYNLHHSKVYSEWCMIIDWKYAEFHFVWVWSPVDTSCVRISTVFIQRRLCKLCTPRSNYKTDSFLNWFNIIGEQHNCVCFDE